jgi:hypothetical protein
MAECMSMLGVTVLRRAKMLQGQGYLPPAEFLSLPSLSLHQKWLRWVEQESRKRLVYFALSMDAHVSMARNIAVLFDYSELDVPLPASKLLWEAESASKWHEIIQSDLELRTQQPLPLRDILRRPCLPTTHRVIADMTCTALAFLAGFWSLVQEYQRMSNILPATQKWNDFVLKSRYSELNATLEQFRAGLAGIDDLGPEVLIMSEFVALHLDVSFYELSKYAGTGTEEDARLSIAYVQNWFENPQSRTALWHAGQIFRAAKQFPASTLTDIYVVALFHAAITIWVWSMLRRAEGAKGDLNLQKIALDGEETPTVSRFLKASRALPGLMGSADDFLSLENLTVAPDLANEIIVANWCMEPLPLTAEETSRLMQRISTICQQRFKPAAT